MDLVRLRTLLSIISLPTDPLLERFARLFRFRAIDQRLVTVLRAHSQKNKCLIVDFGCGQDILLYKYICFVHPELVGKFVYIGIDPLLQTTKSIDPAVRLLKSRFEKARLKEKVDLVVMLAVLEHVDDDVALLQSAVTMLAPNGRIIGTTPTPLAKWPLEFLAHTIGTISPREIAEHKRYPTKESIQKAVLLAQKKTKRKLSYKQRYFEGGLNNYFEIGVA